MLEIGFAFVVPVGRSTEFEEIIALMPAKSADPERPAIRIESSQAKRIHNHIRSIETQGAWRCDRGWRAAPLAARRWVRMTLRVASN